MKTAWSVVRPDAIAVVNSATWWRQIDVPEERERRRRYIEDMDLVAVMHAEAALRAAHIDLPETEWNEQEVSLRHSRSPNRCGLERAAPRGPERLEAEATSAIGRKG